MRTLATAAPLLAFILQYLFSLHTGTTQFFWHHPTIVFLDWLFVPFNYLVVPAINWRRGRMLTALWCVAIILNSAAHGAWQITGADPGHMINRDAVLLPAGWAHFVFATFETVLLLAFVFCRRDEASHVPALTALMCIYFVGVPLCSYFIHGRLAPSDLVVGIVGLLAAVGYPLARRLPRENE